MPVAETKLNITKEQQTEDIPANCLFTPRTYKDLLCYYSFILFLTSFLWLAGIYIWGIHDSKEEESVGQGLTITGIVVGGGSMLLVTIWCLLSCGKSHPEETRKGEEIEMEKA